MRKKHIKNIMLVIILSLLMVGCDKPEEDKKPEIEDVIKELSFEEVEGENGLYHVVVPNMAAGDIFGNVMMYDEDSLFLTISDMEGVKNTALMINIYSGEKEAEINYGVKDGRTYSDVYIGKDKNIYFSERGGNVSVYSSELELIDTIMLGNGGDRYFDSYKDEIYYISDEGNGKVYRYSIEKNKSEEIHTFEEKFLNIYIDGFVSNEQIMILSSYDEYGGESKLYLSTSDSTIKAMPISYTQLMTDQDEILVCNNRNVVELFDFNNSRVVKQFALNSKEEVYNLSYDFSGQQLITTEYKSKAKGTSVLNNSYVFRVYSMKTDSLIYDMELESDDEVYSVLSYDSMYQNYAFITNGTYENSKLYLWNLDEIETSNVEELNIFSNYSSGITKEINNKIVKKLEKNYGIDIKVREEVVTFFPDFAVTPIYDEELINTALAEVDTLFSSFPEGFFEKFTYDNVQGLEVYLCGTLVQGAEEGTSTPAAFALQNDGKQLIVVDIQYPIRQNLAHELCHAMESRVEYEVDNGEIKGFEDSVWDQFNPEEFKYFYSYKTKDDDDVDSITSPKHTPDDIKSISDIDNIYFIDGYAKSFPSEDRARIFEYLFGVKTEELPEAFKSQHIKDKAEYLIDIFEKVFECEGKLK